MKSGNANIYKKIIWLNWMNLTTHIRTSWVNAAVLKLGVATLLRVAKYFLRVAKDYQAFYQVIFYLIIIVICSILGSPNLKNILKRVVTRDTKSLRTPELMCLRSFTKKIHFNGGRCFLHNFIFIFPCFFWSIFILINSNSFSNEMVTCFQ